MRIFVPLLVPEVLISASATRKGKIVYAKVGHPQPMKGENLSYISPSVTVLPEITALGKHPHPILASATDVIPTKAVAAESGSW